MAPLGYIRKARQYVIGDVPESNNIDIDTGVVGIVNIVHFKNKALWLFAKVQHYFITFSWHCYQIDFNQELEMTRFAVKFHNAHSRHTFGFLNVGATVGFSSKRAELPAEATEGI